MATVQEDAVAAQAFCPDARCAGYKQEPVAGVRTTTSWTYVELGGDLPGFERSSESVRFGDESDVPCSFCDRDRLISEQVRPEYANISGHDPMGIFEFKGKTDGQLKDLQHQREIDELNRNIEMRDLKAELEELKSLMKDAAPKRGPGRPAKAAEES